MGIVASDVFLLESGKEGIKREKTTSRRRPIVMYLLDTWFGKDKITVGDTLFQNRR